MIRSIRERVTVQDGGRIEIRSSDLPVGSEAEVTVVVEPAAEPVGALRDMIGKGRGSYPTARDADRFIRRERDSWEQ